MPYRVWWLVAVLCLVGLFEGSGAARPGAHRAGPVRVKGHCLEDDRGPFLGLGASYFTALWRCKHDRKRLESDLALLAANGFNYYRMLSMVGWNASWDGLEIAPAAFTSHAGKRIPAWDDYWQQLRDLIDLAYDRYGLRTQITVFADAQLMPRKEDRLDHLRRLLADVVAGREQKIILIEVANEAWQNGFPGETGVGDLREFAAYLGQRTKIPVAITSNHEGDFAQLYRDSAADIATWHFSRDRRPNAGWEPVYDCWRLGDLPGLPPASSNEPIGPGASVNSERDEVRLVAAAAFAYVAKLPMYVFHCEAGVHGRSRFEETPGLTRFRGLMELLPHDLPNWQRNDGLEPAAPFTTYAGGGANRYWSDDTASADGCVRNVGSRRGKRFVCLPIGIRPAGVDLEARQNLRCRVYNLLTGGVIVRRTLDAGERVHLPRGPGALLVIGTLDDV